MTLSLRQPGTPYVRACMHLPCHWPPVVHSAPPPHVGPCDRALDAFQVLRVHEAEWGSVFPFYYLRAGDVAAGTEPRAEAFFARALEQQ